MKTNSMKRQTAGFRAAAFLAVLGATVALAHSPDESRVAGDAVALEEVVLVSKTTSAEGVSGNLDLPLLGGGGGGGLPLVGGLPLLGSLPLLGN
ncbi:hypothetical protein [Archangium primigenium]|uniref:hypothetical protein n=1 Tax=[Archangium] primigenium TaxID=2792470 RepID=UPI00195E9B90|nr:hypothetical protein [Archangium primigenium]MBM7113328.1 hypothetical protein [Archangium primigenium]